MSQPAPGNELPRQLSLFDSIMLNVSSMIGSGIFLVPATVALYLHSSFDIILAWVIGGIVSMFGALSYAELGAMMPHTGGQYIYLQRTYGPLWGFLFGWSSFTVIMTASISAVAVGFAQYMTYFIPMNETEVKFVAIISILFLTTVNIIGTKFGAQFQNVITLSKIASLLVLIVSAAYFYFSSPQQPVQVVELQGTEWGSYLSSFGMAMLAILWAYDGWVDLSFVSGEVVQPERSIHRSLIISTAMIIVLYVAVNLSYLVVLPVSSMASSHFIASDAAVRMMGNFGASFITASVMISMLGANQSFILTAPRIYYAMARKELFFHSMQLLHATRRTPVIGLLSQAAWASVLVLLGTFDQLITYIIFAIWIFYALSCAAVIILRKRNPDAVRPYKTWGYPYTPIIFILFALALVGNTIIENPMDAAIGLLLVFSGVPAYWYWKRKILLNEKDNNGTQRDL
ncbi:MAG: amino acid permease [Bacteroidota bacterium]